MKNVPERKKMEGCLGKEKEEVVYHDRLAHHYKEATSTVDGRHIP